MVCLCRGAAEKPTLQQQPTAFWVSHTVLQQSYGYIQADTSNNCVSKHQQDGKSCCIRLLQLMATDKPMRRPPGLLALLLQAGRDESSGHLSPLSIYCRCKQSRKMSQEEQLFYQALNYLYCIVKVTKGRLDKSTSSSSTVTVKLFSFPLFSLQELLLHAEEPYTIEQNKSSNSVPSAKPFCMGVNHLAE